jgi:hypothetical protein
MGGMVAHRRMHRKGLPWQPAAMSREAGKTGVGSAVRGLFDAGMRWATRFLLWTNVLSLPAACYACRMPYGGGILAGPLVALMGPLAGAIVGFFVGACVGAARSPHPWLVVPAIAVSIGVLGGPYGCYALGERRDERRRELHGLVVADDPAPFLRRLREPEASAMVREELDWFLVCAAESEHAEVFDAVAALDVRGKDGDALCAAVQYGRPALVARLLSAGYQPSRAHDVHGEGCDPLRRLIEASRGTSTCWEEESFAGSPTPAGCAHRAEIAGLLLAAGDPPLGDGPATIPGCVDAGHE